MKKLLLSLLVIISFNCQAKYDTDFESGNITVTSNENIIVVKTTNLLLAYSLQNNHNIVDYVNTTNENGEKIYCFAFKKNEQTCSLIFEKINIFSR